VLDNAALTQGLTLLPPAEEQALLAAVLVSGIATCGRGNGGGLCIVSARRHSITVRMEGWEG